MLSLRKAPPLSGAAAALCQGTLRVGLLRVVRWQLACVPRCAAVSLRPLVRTFLLVSFNFVVYTHDAHTHTRTDTNGHTHTRPGLAARMQAELTEDRGLPLSTVCGMACRLCAAFFLQD